MTKLLLYLSLVTQKIGGDTELMEEQQGSRKRSKTGGTPEADALKISIGDPPPNDDADTATPRMKKCWKLQLRT